VEIVQVRHFFTLVRTIDATQTIYIPDINMDLYAAGFNAWRQLEFFPLASSTEEPDDIMSFRRVLSDDLIEVQYISLTYTIGV
jgi:hypothetical protein